MEELKVGTSESDLMEVPCTSGAEGGGGSCQRGKETFT